MCGIAGLLNLDFQPVDAGQLQQMNDIQIHRGPDAGDTYIAGPLGLAHRRLSIIDIASGQQPLVNVENNAVIVFNGEIYNFASLREELIGLGAGFRTHSDTEVILQAWKVWGKACVKRLRGMFAFAIWDKNSEQLFIARDRLGIKPLYYSLINGRQLAFASELKALQCLPQLDRQLDARAIADYFTFGYIPDPKSILAGVHKLPPGHTLLLERGQTQPTIEQYWDASFADPFQVRDQRQLDEELIERLREAVGIRLISEVPIGAFLSGGVDSSAVVALMAGLMQQPVNTCSIGFDVPSFNETEFARQVAERYQTNHQEHQVAVDDFGLLDTLSGLYDEPYADSSAIPTYRVCEQAKKRVTVCLSGDGGDELFAGYRRYRWHLLEERIRGLVPSAIRQPVFGLLGNYYPKLDRAPRYLRAKSTFQALQREALAAYLHSVSFTPEPVFKQLFTPEFNKRLNGYRPLEVFEGYQQQFDGDDPLSLIQYLDMKTYLPGDILTKVDRASMAHSLEVRVPLLDHEFLGWANRIPAHLKLHRREGKHIFKRALEPHLPRNVLYRPKMGFGVPVARWIRGPLADTLRQRILRGHLQTLGIFNQKTLERLADEHIRGTSDHSVTLWALLMFEASIRRSMTGDQVAAA
ncbi:XrtA/PEP-CTERM system amidotransferase [Marinobacterium sedimentorum]|uniref:XrtA/PEP-CTERM system amidotransferase n=1 Tax=Marinobacterium sedimentorum TaxID=2927804 RepID=UPI0020C696DA|nr:XrtA/PEP-CTERM system amidotransferase [Marinobacterium sedimentorum]MCP8686825.1 amidotransferase 1, exosortase A system-associated [Marinobacterium sedimentorum]